MNYIVNLEFYKINEENLLNISLFSERKQIRKCCILKFYLKSGLIKFNIYIDIFENNYH